MLSTENNHPCPNCEISQLKSSDERDYDNNQEADMFNSGLDDNNINSPLPNFSIRDYVFSTRVKDIKNNWPFSYKNLQLCLKYGVKDVLPPFDSSLNPARNLSFSDGKLPEPRGQKLTVDIKEFTFRQPRKVEPNIQKKCTILISEATTMASKVCPVCKTFSSSSNTTLNAHIDQCLSSESAVKWTSADLKEVTIKHRIKPRKMRSMVDVYATALHGTLEDLDRRNGTNWASNMGFQDRDSDACAADTNVPYSTSANIKDVNKDADVYIDSNGTKVRILSKLVDLPSSSKAVKRDKGNYFNLPIKKKKCLVLKQKLLDHCDYSPRPEVNNGQQKMPEVFKEFTEPRVAATDQVKPDDMGMIKQWVGSKRSGLREKINPEHERNSRTNCNASSPGDLFVKKRNSASKSQISSDKKSPGDLFVKKRNSASKSEISFDKKSLLAADHQNQRKEKKFLCSSSVNDCGNMDPRDGLENHNSLPNNDNIGINAIPAVKKGTFSSQGYGFSSLGKKIGSEKFSSLRKKLLSVRHASAPESKKKMRRKHLDFKKRRLHFEFRSEGEANVVPQNLVCRQDNVGENEAQEASELLMSKKTRVLKTQKKTWGFVDAAGKGDVSLNGSETMSPKFHSHGRVRENVDSFTNSDFPVDNTCNNIETRDEFVCEPGFEMAGEEASVAFSKSLDSTFCGPTDPYDECFSPRFVGHCHDELVQDLVTHNSHHDSAEYYVDVDPIPIPGPPGSFLPSPRRMGSEELQGISSLTTCRVQSSEDEREIVDMNPSDSPVSAISVVSNSCAPGSESPYILNWSVQSYVRQALPETPTPSASSNPVLRLMGKNLMVANKDEINRSPNQTRLLSTTQSSVATIQNPSPWLCVDNSLPTSIKVHNEPHSFRCVLSGGPSKFENTQTSMIPAQHFDFNSSDGCYGIPSKFSTPHFLSTSFGGNLCPSSEYAASGCNLMSNQLGSYDSPESHEVGLGIKATHSSRVNPFYGNYQTRGYPMCAGSPIFHNGNAQLPFSKGLMNGNLGKWIDRNAQGSNMVRPVLPSAAQLRSNSMYFSPAPFS